MPSQSPYHEWTGTLCIMFHVVCSGNSLKIEFFLSHFIGSLDLYPGLLLVFLNCKRWINSMFFWHMHVFRLKFLIYINFIRVICWFLFAAKFNHCHHEQVLFTWHALLAALLAANCILYSVTAGCVAENLNAPQLCYPFAQSC